MHFKAPDNSLHFLDDDQYSYLLPIGSVAIREEEAASIVEASKPVTTVRDQIAALEATITQRRLREAALGIDGGWLAAIDSEIALLRKQLTTTP